MTAQTFEFQTETRRLLDLVINSLYSNRDIFLRELVSNASDALDKRRFAATTNSELAATDEPRIWLELDADARVLTISDNGIGMTRQEVIDNIGTIARSGSQEFVDRLAAAGAAERPELIGQFGVGFYSSFLVADRVTMVTRAAGESTATLWESDGAGSYTIGDAERADSGTSVSLHLKAVDGDEGIRDYVKDSVVRDVVSRYSDFVSYPIKLGDDTLNTQKAIWARPEADVEDAEYAEFYKHISHDWFDPLARVRTTIEGTFEARSLLFIPSKAPFDLYHANMNRRGIQLYVKRVFIMDEATDLLPVYLRFVKGVVDAEDLPLNISRETLQQNRQIAAIRRHIVKKVLDKLASMQSDDRSSYETFWREFGPVLKEGLLMSQEREARILDLVLCESTNLDVGLTTLGDYVDRMNSGDRVGQKVIYYITGATADRARRSPHLEAFREKGIEVAVFSDQVDELWLNQGLKFRDVEFQSVGEGDIDLAGDDEQAAEKKKSQQIEYSDLFVAIRAALQEQVKEVRLSNRLTSSASCLVTAEGELTPQMERLMKATGQSVPKTKRILELNAGHPVMQKLREMFAASAANPAIAEYAALLYGQALLAEGGQLDDPGEFARLVGEIMVRAAR